tara:strand:- start:3323 stop:3619 length:297 start_codon:yes stop_codon:yes gene_type:complete
MDQAFYLVHFCEPELPWNFIKLKAAMATFLEDQNEEFADLALREAFGYLAKKGYPQFVQDDLIPPANFEEVLGISEEYVAKLKEAGKWPSNPKQEEVH